MIWWHQVALKHTVRWGPFGITYTEARCSCGKRWIR